MKMSLRTFQSGIRGMGLLSLLGSAFVWGGVAAEGNSGPLAETWPAWIIILVALIIDLSSYLSFRLLLHAYQIKKDSIRKNVRDSMLYLIQISNIIKLVYAEIEGDQEAILDLACQFMDMHGFQVRFELIPTKDDKMHAVLKLFSDEKIFKAMAAGGIKIDLKKEMHMHHKMREEDKKNH